MSVTRAFLLRRPATSADSVTYRSFTNTRVTFLIKVKGADTLRGDRAARNGQCAPSLVIWSDQMITSNHFPLAENPHGTDTVPTRTVTQMTWESVEYLCWRDAWPLRTRRKLY